MDNQNSPKVNTVTVKSDAGCIYYVFHAVILIWVLMSLYNIEHQTHRTNILLEQINKNCTESIHLQRSYNVIIEGIVNRDG